MNEALVLARKGLGRTSPNPAVGCAIVKDGEIVGRGWHKKAGGPHAEIEALKEAGAKAKGATMYVTLEPCCHQGKTGPCTKAIIEAGITKVVVATRDPNQIVCGRGCEELRLAGIEVETGLLEEVAKRLNEAFEKYITTKTPFVVAKAALTLDGKMSAADGSSKWISCEESRRAGHGLRNIYDAIMVGANTLIKDNPLLTCRIEGGRNPIRVVIDSVLKVPLNAKVFNKEARTIVFTTTNAPKKRAAELKRKGVEVVVFSSKKKEVDLRKVMKELGKREIMSVMIEGGPTLLGSAFDAGLVDKVMFFIAPKVLGEGTSIRGNKIKDIKDAIQLDKVETYGIGSDLLVLGYPKK